MEENENIKEDENIKVDCREITPEGELICDIDMKDAAEMLRRKIKPSHTKLNVKDKVLDSSQSAEENKSSEGTKPAEENKSSEGTKPAEENKSSEGTKPAEENKSSEGTKPAEADSSNKQGCGCFKTTENSKIDNFVAEFLTKNEED